MALSRWIDEHLETFVHPVLGFVPSTRENDPHNEKSQHLFHVWSKTSINVLQLLWLEAKKKSKGRKILLAGRDVYLFEILAQVEGFPLTVFRPEMSGQVAKSGLIPKESFEGYYMVDTGYRGSVPQFLEFKHWDLVNCAYGPSLGGGKFGERTKEWVLEHQLFGMENKYAFMAGNMEGSPKYWNPGTISKRDTPQAVIDPQTLVPRSSFYNAALLTMLVATQHEATLKLAKSVKSVGRGI